MIKISLNSASMGPIDNVPALVQIMAGAEQSTSHYQNQCRPSSLTHVCVIRPWCINMISEYDGNIDKKNTTSRSKHCTELQIIVYTTEMNVTVIIWRNRAASYALMAVVCSCVWMGLVLKANISWKISSLLAPGDVIWQHRAWSSLAQVIA